ncbi:MAG: penicillin-binding protein activator [Gammaproteobacteria bacterium]|nr:penicillin-binding protein activator [Gammaproteobacteria bacterium]NNF49645.1 penicillin-binding protein activator [Woeseiaceae bacterium]NNL63180.1 penicillin-binding protein activator [Woeseiaceae bacterium]
MQKPQHPARERRSLASAAFVAACLLALAACETPSIGGFGGSAEDRAERMAQNGDHDDAAGAYMGLAVDAAGTERERFTLLAVEQYLDAGDVSRARSAFGNVARQETGNLAALWSTNRAAFHLYNGEADDALGLLEPLSRQPLTQRDRLRVEALRADAWIQKQDPARAVELMTQRETWVQDRRGVERNRNRLWQGLLLSGPTVLREAAETAPDPVVRGWLTIGSVAVSTGQQGVGWARGVTRWREQNPQHPAMLILGDLELPEHLLYEYPKQIALLLPLTGNAGSAGKAIQNGFLGAYYAAASGLDDRQAVSIYDVNAEGGANAAYAAAVSAGAEFVVGPLLKKNVSDLANDILVPIPVLTLNYLPQDTLAPPGLYQFALAPEDEAVSAARRALQDGHTRGVALVPNNDWGRRLLRSFVTEFEGLGGTVLDYRAYTPGKQDFSDEIENLMGLSGSVQRYRRLRANIESPLQFDPRRRQDAEFIFLPTDAAAGRLLKAQLKFHYSGDLPVYSTSSVNARDGRSNADLNGIMFADTPWVIDPQPWITDLRDEFAEYWPEERRLARLHAMGYDAYNLIASLYAARGGLMDEIDGATGTLFLDTDGRVHRRLAWAQFQQGEVVALPMPDAIGGPIEDLTDDGAVLEPGAADEAPWRGEAPEL